MSEGFRRWAGAWLALWALCLSAGGAGLGLYENGTPEIGRAGAGRAAAAEDASTAWGNPAGLAFLPGNEILLSAMPLVIDLEFESHHDSSMEGGGSNGGIALPLMGAFGAWRVSDRLTLGVSSLGLLGAGFDYGDDWAGRYLAEDALLAMAGLTSSFGIKVTDWLSVGGGVTLGFGLLESSVALNNGGEIVGETIEQTLGGLGDLVDGLPGSGIGWLPGGGGLGQRGSGRGIIDRIQGIRERVEEMAGELQDAKDLISDDSNFSDGRVEISDTAWGIGGQVGVLVQPSRSLRLGAVYRSPIEFTFEGAVHASGKGAILDRLLERIDADGVDMELTLRVPQEAMVSAAWQATAAAALYANVGWQNWEDFGDVVTTVHVAGEDIVTSKELQMKDAWHFALGTTIRVARPVAVSVGWAYDTSAIETAHRSPALPVDRQIRYSCGVQYDWSERVAVGVGYTYVDMGKNQLDREGSALVGSLQGSYDAAAAHNIAVSLRMRF